METWTGTFKTVAPGVSAFVLNHTQPPPIHQNHRLGVCPSRQMGAPKCGAVKGFTGGKTKVLEVH